MKNPFNTLARALCAFACMTASASHAQIGMRHIQSGSMPITVVYPTAAVAQPFTQGAFTIQVAHNALPLAAATGQRSLIVLSHGTAGSALPDHSLAATLAKAGFVVAQPEHRGDNRQDFSRAGPESWKSRPQEVSETIDAVAKDRILGPLIQTIKVGVHGMSAGGVTALALAGAQWRMLDLVKHCGQHLEEDLAFCLNGLAQKPLVQLERRSQFAMTRLMPENLLPEAIRMPFGGLSSSDPRPDPRVFAVSLVVPVGAIFTAESLKAIRIPVGLTTSLADEVLLPRFHSQWVLANCKSCTLLSKHQQAGHFDWLAPWPESLARMVGEQQMRGGMPHADFSAAQRQMAFDRIALFFKQSLGPQ